MANTSPFDILVGPCRAYVAPTGTAFPDVDDDESAFGTAWYALGQTDGGTRVSHSQTVQEHRTDQVTAPRKATRTEESLVITFSLAELTLDTYRHALNQALGSVTQGTGDKSIKLYRGGFQCETLALLVRGDDISAYADANLQYEVPVVFENGSPEVEYSKEGKALLAVSFSAIADEDADDESELFGVLRMGE